MKYQRYVLLFIPLLAAPFLLHAEDKSSNVHLVPLIVPALLALAGYFAKSLYEIYTARKKRARELTENKLKLFYWPISIALKENENTYQYLFNGKKNKDEQSTEYIIAHYVEKNVLLKNHIKILGIITDYRHLADTDEHFEQLMNAYIRHVTIYKALCDAGINEYPGVATNAPYPTGIDNYFYTKTEALQKKIGRMRI